MNRRTKVPSIPDPTPDGLVDIARAVKSLLDVREGRAGDKQDRFVSFRDLEAMKLIQDADGNANNPGNPGTNPNTTPGTYNPATDTTVPPIPTGFTANGGYGVIILDWDTPQSLYKNHAYTEIWRNTVDVLGNARMIGTSIGAVYTDPTPDATTYYYWIRFVSQANVTGPYNSTSGTKATSAINVPRVIEALSSEITGSRLYQDLNERITDIEVREIDFTETLNRINADVDEGRALLADALSKTGSAIVTAQTITENQAQLITALGTRVGNNEANLVNNYYTRASTDSAIASATTGLVSTTTLNNTLGSYVTSATLTTNYYTKTDTDSAISSATQNLVSNTSLTNTLGSYVTNASLTNNYYTKTQTDSAISSATTSLVSTTTLNNTLGSYVTNATLLNDYYTKTNTDSAISSATQNLVSTTTLNNTLGSYVTNATLTTNYYTRTSTDTAIASAVNQVSARLDNFGGATGVTVEQRYSATASDVDGLRGQYTVKIDNNGSVSGFGLASTPVNGVPTSEFYVNANRFAITAPSNSSGTSFPVSGLFNGYTFYRTTDKTHWRWNGSGWESFNPIVPFIVQTTPTVINGVNVPAGVYMDTAFIRDGTITTSKIGVAVITEAKIAVGAITEAKIGDAQITTAKIAETIQSSNWSVDNTLGWQINKNGIATFNQVTVRGTVYASAGSFTGSITAGSGTIGGITISNNSLSTSNYVENTSGWAIYSDGTARFNQVFARGSIYASGGTIGSCNIGSTYIQSTNWVSGTAGWRINSDGTAEFNGMVTSAQIRSGSTLIDRVSGYEIKSVASSSWNSSGLTGNVVHTNSALTFYGPNNHSSAPLPQRVKNGNVLVQIIASAVLDHYFTLWYRYNGGSWAVIASTVEPSPGVAGATLVYSGEFGFAPSDTVQFGISGTDIYLNPYPGGNADVAIVSVAANLINI